MLFVLLTLLPAGVKKSAVINVHDRDVVIKIG